MFKKYLVLGVSVLILNLSLGASVFANMKTENETKFAEAVKANIAKLGVGKDAQVKVKLKDGTKLKGYVSQINENSFVVINEKTGVSTEVTYQNVKQVKGNNLSKGVKIAIIVGVIFIITVLIGGFAG